ncbi:hypothetical protein EV121DRAFT_266605 [Schizophyllum commune]
MSPTSLPFPPLPSPHHLPKRHASFDSPREVPLPSPQLNREQQPGGFPFPKVNMPTQPMPQPPHDLQSQDVPPPPDDNPSRRSSQTEERDSLSEWTDVSSSLPAMHSPAQAPTPVHPYPRPYSLPDGPHAARRQPDLTPEPKVAGPSGVDRSSSASLPLPMQIPYSTLPRVDGQPTTRAPTATTSAPPATPATPARTAPPSAFTYRGKAPRPISDEELDEHPTAIPRAAVLAATVSHPPEPPKVLETASTLAPSTASVLTRASTVSDPSHTRTAPPSPSAMAASQSTPPSVANGQSDAQRNSLPNAHLPFLSHAPPPADSWIQVETTPAEYRLHIRLPGFQRDGITLATKKRRILHVVADSWENGGGHFERRISFGYDADLVQVRAEFDGEMLRVVIPRRMPPGSARSTMGMAR